MEVYKQASESIEKLLRVKISTSQVWRKSDKVGQGIDEQVKEEIPSIELNEDEVVYAQVDGGMILTDSGWEEVKVGRIFSEQNIKLQSSNTTRKVINHSQYAAYLGSHDQFTSVFENGLQHYENIGKRLVFVTDGAIWIQNWIKKKYPKARMILDFYHVLEHISKAGKLLIKDESKFKDWLKRQKKNLLESKIDRVIGALHGLRATTVEQVDEKMRQIKYLNKNRYRINYKLYRRLGLQIGSGAIEASHRTLVQKRMKRSGQRWSAEGANKMLNLRVAFKSERWSLVENIFKNAAA